MMQLETRGRPGLDDYFLQQKNRQPQAARDEGGRAVENRIQRLSADSVF